MDPSSTYDIILQEEKKSHGRCRCSGSGKSTRKKHRSPGEDSVPSSRRFSVGLNNIFTGSEVHDDIALPLNLERYAWISARTLIWEVGTRLAVFRGNVSQQQPFFFFFVVSRNVVVGMGRVAFGGTVCMRYLRPIQTNTLHEI